jgi:hypothetical protein
MEQAVLLGLGSSRLFESCCGLLLQYTHTGSYEEMIFIWACALPPLAIRREPNNSKVIVNTYLITSSFSNGVCQSCGESYEHSG